MLRLGWVTVDTLDVERQLASWPRLLGPDVMFDSAHVPPPGTGTGVLFYPEGDFGPKQAKNRVHLDLGTRDAGALVARALELGATEADIGQGEVPWAVTADPSGNEFCILAPRPLD